MCNFPRPWLRFSFPHSFKDYKMITKVWKVWKRKRSKQIHPAYYIKSSRRSESECRLALDYTPFALSLVPLRTKKWAFPSPIFPYFYSSPFSDATPLLNPLIDLSQSLRSRFLLTSNHLWTSGPRHFLPINLCPWNLIFSRPFSLFSPQETILANQSFLPILMTNLLELTWRRRLHLHRVQTACFCAKKCTGRTALQNIGGKWWTSHRHVSFFENFLFFILPKT